MAVNPVKVREQASSNDFQINNGRLETEAHQDPAKAIASTIQTLYGHRFNKDQTRFQQTLSALRQVFDEAVRERGMDCLPGLAQRVNSELHHCRLEVLIGEDGQVQLVKNMRGNFCSHVASFAISAADYPEDNIDAVPVAINALGREAATRLARCVGTLYHLRRDPYRPAWRHAHATIQQAVDRSARAGGKWGVAALAQEINEWSSGALKIMSRGTTLTVFRQDSDKRLQVARFEPTPPPRPQRVAERTG